MAKKIDIDFIKKWVDISEEELMQRLVKDAVGLQEEAEKNKKTSDVEKRIQDETYDIAFVKKFFRQFAYLNQYFSDEDILAACKRHLEKRDLAKEDRIRGYKDTDTIYYTVVGHGTFYFTEHRGKWEREVRDEGTVVLISNEYQGLVTSEVTRDLLLQRCPWIKEYNLEIYEIYARRDLIFVKNPDENTEYATKYLYVPFSALMDKDAEKIINPHKKYWHDYGSGKYDEETEKFLSSDFVREFLENVMSPDDEISISDMKDYGYTWNGMYPLSRKKALELFDNNLPIYKLYNDGTEADIDERNEILEYSGMFGIEKHDWEKAK